MSGLEALGVASNVLQLICFATETLGLCKAIYYGRDSINPALNEKTAFMLKFADTTERDAKALKSKDLEKADLVAISQKCKVTSQKIKQEIDKLSQNKAKGSISRTAVSAINYFCQKFDLQKLERELDGYQAIMASQILMRLLKRTDVIENAQKEAASSSIDATQSLAIDLANGTKSLVSLINQTHNKALLETKRVENILGNHVIGGIIDNHNIQAFTESIRYPQMNERWNQINDPHSDTYRWVLDPDLGRRLEDYQIPQYQSSPDVSWPSFVQWLRADTEIWYWISGKPGSGKSTLLKLLASHQTTLCYLRVWQPSVMILNHTFWKPGGGMQSSVKGLWCSLTYQLLSSKGHIRTSVPECIRTTGSKLEHNDWAETEIRDLCLHLLAQSSLAFCIFIDGLDEVNDSDGAISLLESLDDLQAASLERVKLCVSSRLERSFLKHIRKSFELKLHLLTKEDMEAYVRKIVGTSWVTNDIHRRESIEHITRLLTSKSEGVFIWLCLALKSVMQGFQNGDSKHEMLLRVDSLPQEIQDLYQDMWDRLNEHEPIYRDSAVTLFSLVVARLNSAKLQSPKQGPRRNHSIISRPLRESTILGEVLFALNFAPSMDVISGKKTLHQEELQELLSVTSHAVSLRSAGLLEVYREPLYQWDAVRFIHRTAYDYVTGTEHGRSISGLDMRPLEAAHLDIARSFLAQLRTENGSLSTLKPGQWLPFVGEACEGKDPKIMHQALDLFEQCCDIYDSRSESYPWYGWGVTCHSSFILPTGDFWRSHPVLKRRALQRASASNTQRVCQ